MKKENYIFSIITVFISIFFIIMSFQFSASNSINKIGPRIWPLTTLIIMLVLSILLVVKTYFQANANDTSSSNDEKEEVKLLKNPIIFIIASIVGIYILLLNIVGFIIATIIFVYPASILLGMKRKIYAIFLTIISTIIFVSVFGLLLNIPLPRGLGIFREISFYFY